MKSKITLFLSFISIVAIGAVLLVGCAKQPSSDVNQAKIFASYELFYDRNEDATYANATFKFGNAFGTALQLSSPATIKFNGQPIPFNNVLAYYSLKMAGFVNGGTFEYKDLTPTVYTNTISNIKTQAFPLLMDSIKKSNAFTLTWIGDTLRPNEAVNVWIGANTSAALSGTLWIQYLQGSTNVILDANKLTALAINGPAVSVMDRYMQTNALQVTSVGGTIKSTYRAMNKNIHLY